MRAIDADAFDERVRVAGGMSEEELTEDFKDGVQAVLYMLSKQPTIQPEPLQPWEVLAAQAVLSQPAEPKRGKWIDKGWTGDWQYLTDGRGNCWKNIVCSECGESVRHESKFCPNCGAKMEVTT